MSTFLAPSAPKCPVCDQRVYKMEEILAMNKSWHKSCFSCGVEKGDGCGRTLQQGHFLDHKGTPYCNTCYNKNFKQKGFGYGTASLSTENPNSSSTQKITTVDAPSSVTSGPPIPPTRRGSGGSMGLAAMIAAQKSSASNDSFISSAGVGTASSRTTYENSSPKCPVCDKSVYKMEEILAMNKTWHKSCFTCGANVGDGCGRTIQSGTHLDHDGTPYCNTCYNKNFKQKGFGFGANLSTSTSTTTSSTTQSSDNSSMKPSTLSQKSYPSSSVSSSSKPKVSSLVGSTSPKCPICGKSVYKMEEILAIGESWHKACFTCGLQKGDGCGRTLQQGQFSDHKETPYCNSCYNKNFKPKGFGYGAANLSTEATNQITEVKQNFRRGSGGSEAMAARMNDLSLNETSKAFQEVKIYQGPGCTSDQSSSVSSNLSTSQDVISSSNNDTAPKRRVSIGETFQGDGDEVDESEW